ncbi:PREDICTED: lachesin isoform X1 [Bactrocera latifrons]|uniref:lachesin isoform X1 n=1 Tax=Bactrocera latifrons TaxID=174628 RepID=UPI0008DD437E|nr:PREDICTED: lachesin isoform X1 [Bactrocera latifrons]
MCYQRLSVNNNNHNNLDAKPTHMPPLHYPHGHRWNEPFFDLTMPKNITSLVGKSAYLGCRVKHLGNKTVAWIRHRDLHILTVGTYTYTTDQRFQTSYHRDIDEWTLQIKWAQQRDAGVYECQISTQPVRSFSVNLNIVVPTASILGGPDLYVDKGSTINLTCVIKFSPEPPTHIFWYHQDKVLSEETSGGRIKFKTIKSEETKSILLISDADLLDSGKYSCYPSNTEIASLRVHVLQGERPEAMQTNSAPTARHSAAAQPNKLISALVGAFVLLQIYTFLCKNAGHITEHNNNDQSKQRTRVAALNPRRGPNPSRTSSRAHSSAQHLPLQQQQRPQPRHRQQQPQQREYQHSEIGSSILVLLALALLRCNNVTTVDSIAAPSTEQLTQRHRQPDQMQRQSAAQAVNFDALAKTSSTAR